MRQTVTMLVVLAALVSLTVQLLVSGGNTVMAGPQDAPVMVVLDEREAGAKESATAIYILWPGQRKVESFNSGSNTFTSYDFASRKVISRNADMDFQYE